MRLILVLLQIPSALMVLYLDVLTVAAVFWRRTPAEAQPQHRFAILVPAHDEEVLLPRLLSSLKNLSYPKALYDVHVVADNCSDTTASRAAQGGAIVHERHDLEFQGKGYALRWLLARVRASEKVYDGFVIVDADSVVSKNFLDLMNRHFERGDQAVQCYYGVWNRDDSWSAAVHYARLAVFNNLRPRGRDALGLSAGLRGNGMCLRSELLDRFGWESFALAEDVEFHLKLVEHGTRVTYAPGASVLGEMPTSLRQARSQNVRWERGRLQLLRSFGPRLLGQGFTQRDVVQLDAIAEQLVPPLSVLTAATVLFYALTLGFRERAPRRLATAVLFGQIGYIVTGLRLVNAERRIYLALLRSPLYIAWKLWIYVVAAARLQDNEWIRTARTQQP